MICAFRRCFPLFPLSLIVLLAACAQQPRIESAEPRPARETITRYTVEGRVAVKRGSESRQAGMRWQHSVERDEIELSGPLGQGAARLTRDIQGARLETAAHEKVTAADWSSLAARVLGVNLPLDGMTYWLTATIDTRAETARGAEIERDAAGRPRRVAVNGWQIDYLAYESSQANALPTLMELHRDDINVRLKIDAWQIDQP